MEDLTEDQNEELQNDQPEPGRSTDTNLVRIMAILFVFVLYFFIFLKILFLK
jgi:hypothetical protein